MKLRLNLGIEFVVTAITLLSIRFNVAFANNSLSSESIPSPRVRGARKQTEAREAIFYHRQLHLPHPSGGGGGGSSSSSSGSGGGSSGSDGNSSSSGSGGGGFIEWVEEEVEKVEEEFRNSSLFGWLEGNSSESGGSGGGGGGLFGWLEGDTNFDYLGCLNYTTDELSELWAFQTDMIECTYIHRDQNSTENLNVNNDDYGGYENSYDDDDFDDENMNDDGANMNDDTYNYTKYDDDGAADDDKQEEPDVYEEISNLLDPESVTYIIQDDDQNNDEENDEDLLIVTNEDFNGNDEDEEVVHFDPIIDFDISKCDTYENLWVWDLALTCEDETHLEDCTCPFASRMLHQGSIKCSQMKQCPEECPICHTCFRLIGCDSHNPLVIAKNNLPNYSVYYAVASAISLLAFGTCFYYIARCCKNKKDIEQENPMMNSPKHLGTHLLVQDEHEDVEFNIAKKPLSDDNESTASQSTYSRTTITSLSRDEQAQKSKDIEKDFNTNDEQQILSRQANEEICERLCQEVVYDEGTNDSLNKEDTIGKHIKEETIDTEKTELQCSQDHFFEEKSQERHCQEVIFVEDIDDIPNVDENKEDNVDIPNVDEKKEDNDDSPNVDENKEDNNDSSNVDENKGAVSDGANVDGIMLIFEDNNGSTVEEIKAVVGGNDGSTDESKYEENNVEGSFDSHSVSV